MRIFLNLWLDHTQKIILWRQNIPNPYRVHNGLMVTPREFSDVITWYLVNISYLGAYILTAADSWKECIPYWTADKWRVPVFYLMFFETGNWGRHYNYKYMICLTLFYFKGLFIHWTPFEIKRGKQGIFFYSIDMKR